MLVLCVCHAGVVVPILGHMVTRYSAKPSRLPPALFSLVCVVANMLSVGDMILRTHKVVEPLQRAARCGQQCAVCMPARCSTVLCSGGSMGLKMGLLLGLVACCAGTCT